MLSPKRTKFRKHHRGRMRGKAYRNNTISFGDYALQSQECGWITSRQIEATRRTITRSIKRGGKLWITIFPDKPVTARAAESLGRQLLTTQLSASAQLRSPSEGLALGSTRSASVRYLSPDGC